MTQPLVAVTAATGKTGQATVRELLKLGLPVRALVRQEDARSEALRRQGAEIVVADLFDGESMAGALRGVQRAYYCPPLDPKTRATLTAFMHAAEVNRLEAVAAMSQWIASPHHPALMTRDMWAVEQMVPTLKGATVTILNPGFFADNYLRVTIGMAAQLGLYPNFVGESRNAPPSNDDMARVAAGVLADPPRHAGRRYRITGPELIGVHDITAAMSKVLGRNVRPINAPEWLLNKVAAYRREARYDMAAFHHYLVDHRQGAFAYGAPSQAVLEVTGKPAESFATTVQAYAGRPEVQRNPGAFGKALAEFMLAPAWRGYDHDRYERQLDLPHLPNPLYAMEDVDWKASHADPDAWAKRATPQPLGGATPSDQGRARQSA